MVRLNVKGLLQWSVERAITKKGKDSQKVLFPIKSAELEQATKASDIVIHIVFSTKERKPWIVQLLKLMEL